MGFGIVIMHPDVGIVQAVADLRLLFGGQPRIKAVVPPARGILPQRRQAMLDELADVLQTVGNLITAFGITDEEVGRAMGDCLERNRRKGRL